MGPWDRGEAYLNMALERLHLGDSDGAIELFRASLTEEPENPMAHAGLALALADVLRLTAARDEAGQAIALAPDHFLGHLAMGLVAMTEHRVDEAEAHLTRAVALEPENPTGLAALGRLHLNQGAWQAAHDLLYRGLEIEPDDVDLLVLAGTLHFFRGDRDTARSLAVRAMELDAESAEANVLMGRLALADGDREAAMHHALVALSRDATDPEALTFLCAVKARQNPVLGLWWRFSELSRRYGERGFALILVLSYLFVQLGIQVGRLVDQSGLAYGLLAVWLVVCGASLLSSLAFQQRLNQDLERVRVRRDF